MTKVDKPAVHEWLRGGQHSSKTLPYIADFLYRQLRGEGLVCDAGCGNGDLLIHLSDRGWLSRNLIGVDVEPGHVAVAKSRYNFSIYNLDFLVGKEIAGLRGSCAAIVAVNWLHNDWRSCHILDKSKRRAKPDPDLLSKFFQRCDECLLPGGVVVADWRGGPHAFLQETDPLVYAAAFAGFRVQEKLPLSVPTYAFVRARDD